METLEPAWVLHARAYRDSSLLLDLFTASAGRVGVVAKGARRQRKGSSQSGLLQPFRPLWVSWGGRSELRTLHTVEARAPAVPLTGYALFSGLYVNELVERLLHRDDPHDDLFLRYEHLLPTLTTAGSGLDVLLRHFELALLDDLGYGFSLVEDSMGACVTGGGSYRFEPDVGLVAADPRVDQAALFAGEALLAFTAGNYTVSARQTVKRLCREALRPYLGERPLVSRQLFGGRA